MQKLKANFFTTLLFFILTVVAVSILAQSVSAHAGGGPPFLLINGKYAQTNPFFLGGPDVPVSQDTSPITTVVNQPITIAVDLAQLQVPPDVAKNSTFRWTWEDGGQEHEFGVKLEHTYSKVGSHLMTLEVKGPQELDWLVLDTVQLNIVPTQNYQLPTGVISVVSSPLQTKVPIEFVAQTTADPSVKGVTTDWYFDGQKVTNKSQISQTYSDSQFADYIFLKVTDANGLSSDAAIQAAGDNNSISLSNLDPKNSHVAIVQKSQMAIPKQSNISLIIGATIIIVIIGGVIINGTKRRKM